MTATMTNAQLTEKYNDLAFGLGHSSIKPWKGKRDVLEGRIRDLQFEMDAMSEHTKEDEEPTRTIRAAAIELLCFADYYEDREKPSGPDNVVDADEQGDARSVGLPYDEIIRRIKEEFSAVKCETTVACLRWYAVKIRVEEHGYEGLRLPQRRPRVKSTKKGG
jgi:hypothetical protein